MTNRRIFLQQSGLAVAGLLLHTPQLSAQETAFPEVRVAAGARNFTSKAIEAAIASFSGQVKNRELAWLFGNCFPNTLDTTVFHTVKNGRPDTYVITGDIDAMWLRDSSAQVWPYLPFMKEDPDLQQLVAGVINRQTRCILKDPYANAFYADDTRVGEWKNDLTAMKPGLHERKWEIDSLCYPIRLAYRYWKQTGDSSPFDEAWLQAMQAVLKTFSEQQRKEGDGPYSFQRQTSWGTDGVPMAGFGYPVKPVGLICSAFRPSDDATVFSFLVPANFFAVLSLRQAAEMVRTISNMPDLAARMLALAAEVETALKQYAVVPHRKFGNIYAYEVNGMGSCNLMDDANVPSLLAMPYLGLVSHTDPVYINTRNFIYSTDNPFYFRGSAAAGIGGPHAGKDMIWPMSIIMKALTSNRDAEIRACIRTLQQTHAQTGWMHESFHKNDPQQFTRKWFAWANTLFGELLWKTFREKPQLLV